MAVLFKLSAKFTMVVDFAIESDPQIFVFVGKRLMAAGKIDDTQSPVAQTEIVIKVEAFIIRPAMNHGVCGSLEDRSVNRFVCSEIENPANPTHGINL